MKGTDKTVERVLEDFSKQIELRHEQEMQIIPKLSLFQVARFATVYDSNNRDIAEEVFLKRC